MSRSDKFALLGGELHSRPERAPRPIRQEKAPLNQPDLFDYVPPVRKTHLLLEEAPLLTVTNRAFGETERDDGWLYLLLPVEQGWALMEAGLPLDPRSPVSLSERSALPSLFSSLSEEHPETEPLLLRVRKAHVAPFLESDPDMSARLGASCYLLSRQTPIG